MDKLKPCPFCGGKPVTSSLRTIVECFCLAQPAIEAHTPHDAAEEWNTRADSAELTAASARIAELETAVADAYKAIENDPAVTDTVWFSDTETLCDRLFRALGEDRAAALLEKK